MGKLFSLGFLLGLVFVGVTLYYLRFVDVHREESMITVQPNGGNSEVFHITLPRDRILAGVAGADPAVPEGLEWPDDPMFSSSQTELFKVRNSNDTVIGIASRMASTEPSNPFVHWMMHLPARGTIFLNMRLASNENGEREGELQAGTNEFAELTGSVRERYTENVENVDFDMTGRIDLMTQFVAPLSNEPLQAAAE